jgi:outer membrane protein assembly factor BamB
MFEAPIGAYTGASVALADGMAYFGTFDNEVLALDLKTHQFKWRYKHAEREFPFMSSAAVAGGKVVVGGRDKMIHALDSASGKALWTYMTRARVESSPAVAGSRVYVGSGDGRFYVFDLATGAKVWEYDMGGALSASVIGSQDGRLVCFG